MYSEKANKYLIRKLLITAKKQLGNIKKNNRLTCCD